MYERALTVDAYAPRRAVGRHFREGVGARVNHLIGRREHQMGFRPGGAGTAVKDGEARCRAAQPGSGVVTHVPSTTRARVSVVSRRISSSVMSRRPVGMPTRQAPSPTDQRSTAAVPRRLIQPGVEGPLDLVLLQEMV